MPRPRLAPALLLIALLAACSLGGDPAVSGLDPLRLIDVLPADRIPPIDRPQFTSIDAAGAWLSGPEPVVALEIGREARAYPAQILVWHEVVNDDFGGVPVVVTYSALAGTAAVFDRRVRGSALRFAPSGKLFRSTLVLYDRETESLWSQPLGAALLGPHKGTSLEALDATLMPFDAFRRAYPAGKVLSRETGVRRAYGYTPYPGYERDGPRRSFLIDPPDPRLAPMSRVLVVVLGRQARAYPFPELAARQRNGTALIEDEVGAQRIVVVWRQGMASAEDREVIAAGRDGGWAVAFLPEVGGRSLHFNVQEGRIVDRETGSVWNEAGRAVAGRLAGTRLSRLPATPAFWFSWAALRGDTTVWGQR